MPLHDDALRVDPDERRAPRRRSSGPWIFALALLAAVAIAGYWWLSMQRAGPAGVPVAPAQAPAIAQPPVRTGPQYPIETLVDEQALGPSEVEPALADLVGRQAMGALLHSEGFPRRVVATLDNLGREHAPAALWPVTPAPGRFQVEEREAGTVIAPANAARYAALVQLADSLPVEATVRLYRRMYPLLQAAYAELGFPGRPLNDRVVEVIDLLLASPQPAEPPRLRLAEVRSTVAAQRPWVRYEFADPALQSLPAGQKILVRVGPANAGVLKRKLTEFRRALVAPHQDAPTR